MTELERVAEGDSGASRSHVGYHAWMRFEPHVDRDRLLAVVRTLYDLPADALQYVPVGYAAACYRVTHVGEPVAFLKLWPDTRSGRANAAGARRSLPLTRAMHDRGIEVRVTYPMPARDGALRSSVDGMPFAVYPFIAGEMSPEWGAWPSTLLVQLGAILAALHRSTPRLADVLPERERFDMHGVPDLLRGLNRLESADDAWPGIRDLKATVAPHADEIREQVARLGEVQRRVRLLPDRSVLCHTDIWPGNMILEPDGTLVLLDWDDARVAPPEHDLQAGLEADLPALVQAYREAGGERNLKVDHFAFYLLRRYLSDMTVRFLTLLDGPLSPEQAEEELYGITAYGFDQWRQLDAHLTVVAQAIS